jgi:hypothetical protein
MYLSVEGVGEVQARHDTNSHRHAQQSLGDHRGGGCMCHTYKFPSPCVHMKPQQSLGDRLFCLFAFLAGRERRRLRAREREQEREGERERARDMLRHHMRRRMHASYEEEDACGIMTLVHPCVCLCVCVCVQPPRQRERDTQGPELPLCCR